MPFGRQKDQGDMPTSEDCQTLQSIHVGLDHIAKTLEAKWGVGRLPLLIDADLRAKFERQQVKTYEALETAWHAQFVTRDQLDAAKGHVSSLERGWKALDAAAEATGAKPIAAVCTALETALADGTVLTVVATNAEAAHMLADGRKRVVMTMDEIRNVLALLPDVVLQAKRAFPGATVLPAKPWPKEGDSIPFGD